MACKKGVIQFQIGLLLFFLILGCSSPGKRRTYPSGKGVYHTVKQGETLWKIAQDYRVEMKLLAWANGLEDPSHIHVGQRLWIPAVKAASKRPGKASMPAVRLGFIWPVKGQVVDRFHIEEKSKNNGIDIATSAGSYVYASLTGQVIFSGKGPGIYGNTIIIDHQNGYVTVYAYNLDNLVAKGQKVNRGEKIARVGSGPGTTPTLHFEIRKDAVPHNPLKLLPPN